MYNFQGRHMCIIPKVEPMNRKISKSPKAIRKRNLNRIAVAHLNIQV